MDAGSLIAITFFVLFLLMIIFVASKGMGKKEKRTPGDRLAGTDLPYNELTRAEGAATWHRANIHHHTTTGHHHHSSGGGSGASGGHSHQSGHSNFGGFSGGGHHH